MSSGVYSWSTIAANNGAADATINMLEGMPPSAVNDGVRSLMSGVAKWRDDMGPNIQTAGTSTAFTLTTNQVFDTLANLANKEFSCFMHATNGASPTLSVDGLTALPIVTDGSTAVPAGTLISGSVYTFVYSNVASKFYLKNIMGNPYNVPLGGMMDYTCPSVPNSNFVFPTGQAISRTTYSVYFGLVGTTYGTGDGSTTFNVIDVTGRLTAMKEASASRLTSTYFGGNSTTLGAVGGLESSTLLNANLPAYTPSGTITNGQVLIGGSSSITYATQNGAQYAINAGGQVGAVNQTQSITQNASTFAGTAQGGTSTPVRTVPPTIIVNKILRIL